MKFVNYLERISGVSIYPLISLLIFSILFIMVVIFVFYTSDEVINKMSNLPLENDDEIKNLQ